MFYRYIFTMVSIEKLARMEQFIRDMEVVYESLPMFIFILKVSLLQAKKETGLTGPILPPVEAPPVEAVPA